MILSSIATMRLSFLKDLNNLTTTWTARDFGKDIDGAQNNNLNDISYFSPSALMRLTSMVRGEMS